MAGDTPVMGPAGPESLIAKPKDPEWQTGMGIADSLVGAWGDTFGKKEDEEWNAFAVGVDGISVGLDALSIIMNPLGELVKAGVGWLMEHVSLLREPLDLLTGNGNAVGAVAETWTNIAKEFSESADAYRQELAKTEGWDGDGAYAYRQTAQDYIGALDGIAGECENTAQGISIAGMVVGTVRALVYDAIASFISRIITEALIAAATSVVSLGSSVAVFISSMLVDLGLLLTKIGKKLAKLIGGLGKFAKKFAGKSANMKGAAKKLNAKQQQLHNWADRTERQLRKEKPGAGDGFGEKYEKYVSNREHGRLGGPAEVADTMAGKAAKEGLKSIKDRLNPGGDDDKSAGAT
jgi:hypothetical protein